MNQSEQQDRYLVSLTEDEYNAVLTLLEPSGIDEEDPQHELYAKLYDLKTVDVGQIFVSEYESTQVYGGPEEGGWYYHTERLLVSQGFPSLDLAIQQLLEDADDPECNGAALQETFIKSGCASFVQTDRYGEGYIYRLEWYPGQYQDVKRRVYE